MPWGRLDDSLYDHPKLDLLPLGQRNACVGLWARAISWCNRFLTDGQLPRDRVLKLDATVEQAELNVAAGLFDETSTGFAVHDFLKFNDSRAQVTERREKEAKRKADWRAKHGHGGSPNGTASVDDGDVPRGVPAGRTAGQERPSRAESRDSRGSARARIPTRPDPTESVSTPHPPASGGRRRRSNGVDGSQYDAVARRDSDEPEVERDDEREPVVAGPFG